ncbi:hydrolase, carbon-nitrogen family [Erwinia amylovora Ea644]|uniref:carbon-nitrogen hydrolase family protein n=1 Tax=Erwinia amylovora TaxID=552 RepID=UPI0002CC4397|nr:carbon-nitrogen hydrolase family protein [Erwinia amylovora]CCP04905.1 hydrolase, carbon-nitrogen family [Erwinia amylovora Ea644]
MCAYRFTCPANKLKVAVAQAEPVAGDIPVNVQQSVTLIERAAKLGAKVVLLPEKFLSGYEPSLIKADPARYAVSTNDERLKPIAMACRQAAIFAVIGAATQEETGVCITSLCFNPQGELFARYHKRALFSSEARFFQPGQQAVAIEVEGWSLGMAICYDSGFAEHARAAALSGCHAYLVSALFSCGNGYHESRIWMPARALDNTLYVLMSNHVGTTGGWQACGGSAVWDPYGKIMVEASAESTEVIVAELDPAFLHDMRGRENMLNDFAERYYMLASPLTQGEGSS